jgi:hypothetical protein
MAPSDGRAYVGLGRILVEQRRFGETIALYEEGTRLTGVVLPLITPYLPWCASCLPGPGGCSWLKVPRDYNVGSLHSMSRQALI